jgi:hypothetical protein
MQSRKTQLTDKREQTIPHEKAQYWVGLFALLILAAWLARDNVGRAGTLFALSDFKLDLLAFIECCIASCLDFRVVDKQIFAAVIRDNKTKSLT